MTGILVVPDRFLGIPYNGTIYPGVPHPADLSTGANCQVFAYAILAHFGFVLPPLRSSELWTDAEHTREVTSYQALDLLLFNRTIDPYGAHVALCVGEGRAMHLSRGVGVPVEWAIGDFATRPEYRVLIGGKRPLA